MMCTRCASLSSLSLHRIHHVGLARCFTYAISTFSHALHHRFTSVCQHCRGAKKICEPQKLDRRKMFAANAIVLDVDGATRKLWWDEFGWRNREREGEKSIVCACVWWVVAVKINIAQTIHGFSSPANYGAASILYTKLFFLIVDDVLINSLAVSVCVLVWETEPGMHSCANIKLDFSTKWSCKLTPNNDVGRNE